METIGDSMTKQLNLDELKELLISSTKEATIDGLSSKLEERILYLSQAIYELGVMDGITKVENEPEKYELIPIDLAEERLQNYAIHRITMRDGG